MRLVTYLVLLILGGALSLWRPAQAAGASAMRPNILFIMSDAPDGVDGPFPDKKLIQ